MSESATKAESVFYYFFHYHSQKFSQWHNGAHFYWGDNRKALKWILELGCLSLLFFPGWFCLFAWIQRRRTFLARFQEGQVYCSGVKQMWTNQRGPRQMTSPNSGSPRRGLPLHTPHCLCQPRVLHEVTSWKQIQRYSLSDWASFHSKKKNHYVIYPSGN